MNAREDLRDKIDEPVSIHLSQISSSRHRYNASTTLPTFNEKVTAFASKSPFTILTSMDIHSETQKPYLFPSRRLWKREEMTPVLVAGPTEFKSAKRSALRECS
jgi:hypothetical protein